MSDQNAMDVDPPVPVAEAPAAPTDNAQVPPAPATAEHVTTAGSQPAGISDEEPATPSTEVGHAAAGDIGPSHGAGGVVTEVPAAVPAGSLQHSDAMVIDENVAIQQTTETTTTTIEAENGSVVQEQTTATTEVTIAPALVEDAPMDAEPEPSLLEKMVTAHTSPPADPTAITTVSRAEPMTPAPPLDVRAPAQAQPTIARTGYVFDPMMMLHCQDGYVPTADDTVEGGSGHPEEPMRIRRIFNRLAEQGLVKRMKQLTFGQVTMEEILLVHSEDHWNKVQGTETLTDQYIQESKDYYEQLSLYVCRETALCARLSCGGVIQACRSVCKGDVRNAFAIVRPPGHHAEPDEHMGFCFFNNVAVAAREMQKEGLAKKVLILDWDVHHGNGTQRAFWNDPDVLYISVHRHDGGKFYPTSDFGALDMVGQGAGEGTSVNIPWPSGGFGDGDYIYAFQKIIMPIAYEFNPDLVIISAGFDAADGDHLGGCHVTPPAYGHMTHMLCALAGGKVVVALEGGYNLEAISRSALAVGQVLLGETPAELGAIEASEVATEVIHQVALVQSKYWKSIDLKACEPPEVTVAADESAVIPIPDLLKIHRAHHMFTKHNLFQIPLASQELEEAFGGQVVCNEKVYEAGTESVLVVFVHDFGNLRVETAGVATTNVHLTNSYLLDTSDKVVNWVTRSGYSLIDVNVLAQIPTRPLANGAAVVATKGDKLQAQLMRYVWDNYVELSEAENVVFIGHGTACNSLMDLINTRDVDRKVKAVVQVAGMHSMVRIDVHNQTRRDWFRKSNRVFVPKAHPVLEDERAQRRLGGQIFTSDKAKVVDVLVDVFPQIQDFVTSKLPQSSALQPLSNGHAAEASVAGAASAVVQAEEPPAAPTSILA